MPDLRPHPRLSRLVGSLMVTAFGFLALGMSTASRPASAYLLSQPAPPCTWSATPGEIALRPGAAGSWDEGGVQSPSIVATDDGYLMAYMGLARDGGAAIGMATSSDGRTWRKEPTPALRPGAPGDWDTEIAWPALVRADDGFHLWYRGRSESSPSQIGYARSTDGLSWQKQGTGPVLAPQGEAERGGLAFPSVVLDDTGGAERFRMWFVVYDGAANRVHQATSADGLSWQRSGPNPVLSEGPIGAWDWPWLLRPSVIAMPGGYLMAYGARALPGYRGRIGFSTSADGAAWQRQPLVLDGVGSPNGQDGIDYPALLAGDDDAVHLWYTGYEGGRPVIGHLKASPCAPPEASRIYLPMTIANAPGLGLGACAAEYRDGFERADSGWDDYEQQGTVVGYRGGQYRMVIRDDAFLWQGTAGATAQDFHLEVDAQPLDQGQGVYGLYFGRAGDELQYRLLVYESEFSLTRMTGQKEPVVLQDWTPTAHIKTPPSTNRLTIRRVGDRIAFSANGRAVIEVRDDTLLRPGEIGLLAGAARDERFEVRFDNWLMREPDCRPGR